MTVLVATVEILRPHNMLAAAACVISGYVLAGGTATGDIAAPALFTALVTGLGNLINDFYDRDIDRINNPSRPLPSGRLSPRYVRVVFWVGTDIGVFIAAKWSEKTSLSIETRQTVLQLGMVLDRLPRSALTLIIPSGCQLAVSSQWMALPDSALLGMWLASGVWLAILWRGFLSTDANVQEQSAKINWVLNLVLAVCVSGAGVYHIFD